MSGYWLLAAAVLLGLGGAWWVSRSGRLDPLERRRLHTVATPRGGGIGIALAGVLGALLAALALEAGPMRVVYLGCATGLFAAAVGGAWEDRRGLGARWRLCLHLLAAALIVLTTQAQAPWWLQLLLIVGMAGLINLVNFMDGAHGLIGLQGVVVGLALDDPMLAAACLGFLPMNFPRARVFLGDVGSYAIGTWIAFLWMHNAAPQHQLAAFAHGWIVLLPIVIDAGLTLSLRMLRGRRWYSAHREHLYQWWVRTGCPPWLVSTSYAVVGGLLALLAGWIGEPALLLPWAVLLSVLAALGWWFGRIALLRRHRRQLRVARRQRRTGSVLA